HHFHDEKHHARHIAAGAVEAGHEALVDRVRSNHEDDRDRRRRRLCRPCRLRAAGSRDHGDRPARELRPQRPKSISSAPGPAVIDADIAMLDIASLAQAAPERRDEVRELAGRFQAEKPDYRHRRLLRHRCKRPRGRRAADKQRYELAAFHVWMAPAWQEIIWRAAQRSLAVMCPACSRSPEGLLALMESANRGLITRAGSMSR